MLGALGAYHPSLILKERRSQKEKLISDRDALVASVSPAPVPTNVAGAAPATQAQEYISSVMDLVGEIEKKLSSLTALAASSIKTGTGDTEQKKLNKDFQQEKRELDALAKQTEIKGDAPLSGKFSQKPKVFNLGDGSPPFELKIEPLHAQGLGIDSLRVDSLSFGKKAKGELERAKEALSGLKSSLAIKLQTVSAKLATASNSVSASETKKPKSNSDFVQEDLRLQQERAARAKGRTFGLLINIKV